MNNRSLTQTLSPSDFQLPGAPARRLGLADLLSAFSLIVLVLMVIGTLTSATAARAQTPSGPGTGTTNPGAVAVTDDQVNAVAMKLYCPVCENISLDTCGTAACAQWRDEIRIQLQQGRTPQQVIDDFVQRYGDRVVGTPQDPTLRALSLATPLIVSVLALVAAGLIFIRWRTGQQKAALAVEAREPEEPAVVAQSEYRAQLERDLATRR